MYFSVVQLVPFSLPNYNGLFHFIHCMQICYLTISFLASIREVMETIVFYFAKCWWYEVSFQCELTINLIVYISILLTLLLSLLAVPHPILNLAHITFAISASCLEEMVLQIQVDHKPKSRQIIYLSWSLFAFECNFTIAC